MSTATLKPNTPGRVSPPDGYPALAPAPTDLEAPPAVLKASGRYSAALARVDEAHYRYRALRDHALSIQHKDQAAIRQALDRGEPRPPNPPGAAAQAEADEARQTVKKLVAEAQQAELAYADAMLKARPEWLSAAAQAEEAEIAHQTELLDKLEATVRRRHGLQMLRRTLEGWRYQIEDWDPGTRLAQLHKGQPRTRPDFKLVEQARGPAANDRMSRMRAEAEAKSSL